MTKNKIEMSSGNLFKNIFLFSFPLILTNLLQIVFNLSDLIVVGQFSGPKALGAVGSTSTLVTLFISFVVGASSGLNSLFAFSIGSKDKERTKSLIQNGLFIMLVIGFIFLFIGLFLADPILLLLSTDEVLIDDAALYIRIYFLCFPACALFNFGNALFASVGETDKPLIFLSISGVLNILMNLFFVIVVKMSVAGVALASVISQYLSAALVFFSLFTRKDIIKLDFKDYHLSKEELKTISSLSLVSGFQCSIFSLANLFVQIGVNSFDTVMIEGNSAALNADSIVYDVMAAFYTAACSFIGNNYGCGNKKRILYTFLICQLYSFSIGMILGLLLYFFGRQFLSLFTSDKEVIDAGMQRLSIMSLCYAFSSFMDNPIACSRGLGKTTIPTIFVILGSVIFRIVWIYTIFAYFKTIPSLYYLYIVSWFITACMEMIYFFVVFNKLKLKN